MRTISMLTLAAALPMLTVSAAGAQSATPDPSGAVPGTNMNAKCTAQDPEVIVDKAAKTYTMAPSDKTPRAARQSHGNLSGEKPGNVSVGESRNSAAASTLVSMCKSEADAMGAKMSPMSTNPNKQ